MHIESIDLFLSVAETQSITVAAKKAHISPQGASATLKALEKHLGFELFDRSSKSLTLTKKGHLILEDARAISKAYKHMSLLSLAPRFESIRSNAFQIIATPFAFQVLSFFDTFTNLFNHKEHTLSAQETNLYNLARHYPDLDPHVLYLIDFPFPDIRAIKDNLPAEFVREVIGGEGDSFFPLVKTDLMLIGKHPGKREGGSGAGSEFFFWDDIDIGRLACYNDPVLVDEIKFRTAKPNRGEIGLVTSNPPLLHQSLRESNMCYIADSLSTLFRILAGMPPLGSGAKLLPQSTFHMGALYCGEDENILDLIAFMKRYLERITSVPSESSPHAIPDTKEIH